MKSLRILGIRGIPAAHGGFETFAERLALHLVERGWIVTVYCQEDGRGPIVEDEWRGIRRVRIPVAAGGTAGTIIFDWRATLHASRTPDLCLTLGYNTAIFCALLRARGIRNVINMDGIEWRRAKWGVTAKAWFYLNERLGCWLGNRLIADHPRIQRHLETRVSARKITMIPYGADAVSEADEAHVRTLGLTPGNYLTVIARPEPENSIYEIVSAFSREKRNARLVVLGNYPDSSPYCRKVKAAASEEVMFVGAIYDKDVVAALRVHSLAYVHGHQVGGTNPSLVEALGAGCAVLAHDNEFNRWVAGDAARYFANEDECALWLSHMAGSPREVDAMKQQSVRRHGDVFTWAQVLGCYEVMLSESANSFSELGATSISQVNS